MRHVPVESRSVVDWVLLLESMGGDPDILEEMAHLFLEYAPAQVADMEAAIAAGDLLAMGSAAHRLKGSLSQFMVQEATRIAALIESHARSGQLAETLQLWSALRTEVARLEECLKDWLAD